MKTDKQQVSELIKSTFAKSRMRKNHYINTDTGSYMDTAAIIEFILLNLKEYENDNQEKTIFILKSLSDLGEMNAFAASKVEELKPVWSFFANFFSNKKAQRIPISQVREQYFFKFGNVGNEVILRNFREWATETNKQVTVNASSLTEINLIVA